MDASSTRTEHRAQRLIGLALAILVAGQASSLYHLTTIRYDAVFLAIAFTPLLLGQGSPPSSRAALLLGRFVWLPLLLVTCSYTAVHAPRLTNVMTDLTTVDYAMGALFALVSLEVVRRVLGRSFLVILAVFGAYLYLQPHIPGTFGGPGTTLPNLVARLYLGTSGLWGTVTSISVLLVAAFILFGDIFLISGAGRPLFSFVFLATRRMPAGMAKGALVISGLFGMLNGSSAANAATTGAFTIPMMKRAGYPAPFAAAVEAVASTGGQIVPPVMGAGAFIIAEFLGISYATIMAAAIVPALAYYLLAFFLIHGFAGRMGVEQRGAAVLDDVPEAADMADLGSRPRPIELLRVVLPLAVLTYLLLEGRSPQNAAFWGVVATIIVYAALEWRSVAGAREGVARIASASAAAAPGLAGLAALGLASQFLVVLIGVSGFGPKITNLVVNATSGSLLVALILTGLVTTVLGMGVATTADFVIASAVMGPALLTMGLDPLAMYLFIFFFACSSSLTPPVCAAVYVASGIAGTHWWPTGIRACLLGGAIFILPFLFAYYPYLLAGPVDGTFVARVVAMAAGIYAFAQAVTGWASQRIGAWRRATMLAVAALSVVLTSTVALVLLVAVVVLSTVADIVRESQSGAAVSEIGRRAK
ncbi:MAG TPA: TRAP transporter fused permease subunit [Thermodesulfobacteriota bacterium]